MYQPLLYEGLFLSKKWYRSLTYISTIPVATIHFVTRGGAQDVLHHAHPKASTFWARWKHRIGITIPMETLAWSPLHHDWLRHWMIWMKSCDQISKQLCVYKLQLSKSPMWKKERLHENRRQRQQRSHSRDDPHALSLHSSPRSIPFLPSLANSSESHSFFAGRSYREISRIF